MSHHDASTGQGQCTGAVAPGNVPAAFIVYRGQHRRGVLFHHPDHGGHQRRRRRAHAPGLAPFAILFAIPFDSLDGRIARMTKHVQRLSARVGFAGRRDHLRRSASLLAFIWDSNFCPTPSLPQLHENLLQRRSLHLLFVLIGGVSRLARFNISHDVTAAQSRAAGPEVFCGHAHSGGGRPDRSLCPFRVTEFPCRLGGSLSSGWLSWASAAS